MAAVIAALACLLAPLPRGQAAADPKQWNDIVDKGIAYMRQQQNDDGSWGKAGPGQLGGTGLIAAIGVYAMRSAIDERDGG